MSMRNEQILSEAVGNHSCGKREARWIHRRTATSSTLYNLRTSMIHLYILHATCYILHGTTYYIPYYKLPYMHDIRVALASLGIVLLSVLIAFLNSSCQHFPSRRSSLFFTNPASGRSCDVIFALCMPLFSSGLGHHVPWGAILVHP